MLEFTPLNRSIYWQVQHQQVLRMVVRVLQLRTSNQLYSLLQSSFYSLVLVYLHESRVRIQLLSSFSALLLEVMDLFGGLG